MTSDELDRLAETALRLTLTVEAVAIALASVTRHLGELTDELERLSTEIYADEQEPPLLVLRKGNR